MTETAAEAAEKTEGAIAVISRHFESCLKCGGAGETVCKSCKGKGRIKPSHSGRCGDCSGMGGIRCSSCGGARGYKVYHLPEAFMNLPQDEAAKTAETSRRLGLMQNRIVDSLGSAEVISCTPNEGKIGLAGGSLRIQKESGGAAGGFYRPDEGEPGANMQAAMIKLHPGMHLRFIGRLREFQHSPTGFELYLSCYRLFLEAAEAADTTGESQ